MGLSKHTAGVSLLAAGAAAQFATYSRGSYGISVNVPANTASTGSGSIYLQISAPSGTQWVGFGQGSRMSGSNMFVVYSSGSNVTVSPRLGTGHSMPQYDSSAQITVLEGSGLGTDGSMVANIRCDSCLSWSGGSMDPTSSSSNWIWAYKTGSSLDSTDQSESINQHGSDGTFTLDLTSGTGGSSANPFNTASSGDSSSSASATASDSASATDSSSSSATASSTGSRTSTSAGTTASATGGVSNPIASSGSDSSSSSSSSSSSNSSSSTTSNPQPQFSHGILMSLLFLGFFPFFSMTIYLPFAQKVRYIHAPLQLISTILLIVGMALGIVAGTRIGEVDGYHMIIGYIIVAFLVLVQPAFGIYQHLHYRRTGGHSSLGVCHRWLGRVMIMLGIVNGGIGWYISNEDSAYAPYGVVAGIVFVIYLAVVIISNMRARRKEGYPQEKSIGSRNGYEMHNPRDSQSKPMTNTYAEQQYNDTESQTAGPRRNSYTISARR